ncbi:PQQ-dependent sugar dehydrogenase [Roseisolibacter sp. H3M3-2]|uniref:PQQ-dependent sugar dehydrogenase n=1 Tax=Roseisolibacter sp. H3M3-2 TaxID=3031323 RepID=UPI0023DA2E64|nr:PQQ-dependent sugar dehydrogenase [Roseisolibacter sp. H3M3-2]MDF1502492.1 PQQ-dependent sugar dehydrogenase [Roseisolibacter sp. H3M3-2]
MSSRVRLAASAALLPIAVLAACAPRGTASDTASASGTSGSSAAAGGEVAAAAAPCATPLETRAPNAADQKPAFPEQTRACGVTSNVAYDVSVVATGLSRLWSVEPLPDGALLVSEKAGRLRVVSPQGQVGQPLQGVPAVDARGQGGLLDVALSPQFATDRVVYWSFTEPRQGGNGTSVARGVLSADRTKLDDVKVILQAMPTYNGTMHYGSRLAFGPDGMLYVTLGERSVTEIRPQAQDLNSHMGKILRVRPDGTVPPDNPFVGRDGARPEIWSSGHRNVQAAAFDAQGRLWDIEHGTRGGDELNLVQKGKNYGWPVAAYGIEYAGRPIANSNGQTQREGTEQPVYYWDPVIAPSGAQFYTGSAFPAWRNSLFVGALKEQRLVRLQLQNDRVTGEEHLLADRKQRIRDVRQGFDGNLYLVTDAEAGEIWKIAPRR